MTSRSVLSVLVMALTACLLCAVPAGAAVAARIDAGRPAELRTGPGTQYGLAGTAADGQEVTVVCSTSSEPVTGKRGISATWDRLSSGVWVAAALLPPGHDGPECGPTGAQPAGDDYPDSYRQASNVVDRWAMYSGQCTSWVAWRLEQTTGYFHNFQWRNGIHGHWGNAAGWADNARLLGYPVDRVPRPGAIAHWEARPTGGLANGHVAYIAAVDGERVTVEEYNWSQPLRYDLRVVPLSQIGTIIHITPGT